MPLARVSDHITTAAPASEPVGDSGHDPRAGVTDARTTVAIVAGAVIVFAAALFRQVGVPKIATVWAEDGAVFLQCAYDDGPLGCVARPYQGYFHLVPRAIAAVAST